MTNSSESIIFGVDERVQVQVAIKVIKTAAELFPTSFKNILAGKQGQGKKDHVTQVLENTIKVFMH